MATTDPAQLACLACGAELPPRITTIRPMGPGASSFLQAFPPICGTAMLSIERMRRLAITAGHLAATVRLSSEMIEVELQVLASHPRDGLALPATLGVAIVPRGGDARRSEAFVELRTQGRSSCRVPRQGFDRGDQAAVRLQYADATHEHDVVVV